MLLSEVMARKLSGLVISQLKEYFVLNSLGFIWDEGQGEEIGMEANVRVMVLK